MSNCFNPANILLPNDGIDMEKWSVIACDQFTSQADYWDAVEKYVGDAPSTLNVVFPEIYLGTIAKQENDCNSSGEGVKNDKETGRKTKYASMTDDERIKYINTTMDTYLTDGTLKQAVADGYVLVERTTESGVRLGIVGLIDLDDYDFDPKKKTLIRATEGTVISRIPPRVKIRENAAIELPHVMLLVDDPIDRQKIDGCQGASQEDAVNIAAVKHGIIEYVYAIRKLGKEYASDIKLYVGFEAEYIPEFFKEQKAMFDRLGCDYMIMGQHFMKSEQTGPYTGTPTDDESRIREYVDTVIEGMKTGMYSYLAHPDLINYQGLDSVYEWEMTRMCKALKELDIPLEINMLGISAGKHYPTERFWCIPHDIGNKVILGLDAHTVDNICDVESYEKALDIVRKYDLNLIDRIEI